VPLALNKLYIEEASKSINAALRCSGDTPSVQLGSGLSDSYRLYKTKMELKHIAGGDNISM
jgi:hypothetical protein